MKNVTQKNREGKMIFEVKQEDVKAHLQDVVRESVEETLNKLLEAEAERICQAKRYERTPDRLDTLAGSYERTLHTSAGEVTLNVPKLRTLPFESQIIDRYRRRERWIGDRPFE